ncbi:MAG: Sua5/YciO/YrdC/YwlC family protein [Planctomycetaceae bacterium]
MTDVVDLRKADDRRDIIHRACELLADGRVVACATETLYVAFASALNPAGVSQLLSGSRDPHGILLLKSFDESRDYVTEMPHVACKLAKRCWPGPLVMTFPPSLMNGLFCRLPPAVQTAVSGKERRVGIRVAAHDVIAAIQQLLPGPLVMTLEDPGLKTATDAAEKFHGGVDLLIDDGPCRYAAPATTVSIDDGLWQIDASGVVSERAITRLASEVYLFVCTGNTCRSPMAEALFRRRLADRLGCREEELADRGHLVVSAGLSAAIGSAASPEAVELLHAAGIDLTGHASQPLTERLLNHADHVYTMTRRHQSDILSERPDLEHTVQLLSETGADISDPIGGGRTEYEDCKQEIERAVDALLNRLFPSTR